MALSVVSVTIADNPPERLDKALARDVPDTAHLSRSRIAKLIAEGAVEGPTGPVLSPKHPVRAGETYRIVVPAPAETETAGEDIPLDIVYEDSDLAVVDKPAGLVVHPAPGSPSGTLVNALLHHFGGELSGVGGEKRPGIVHRIDKDTSGLIVVAKSDAAHHGLAAQFEEHSVERLYSALCHKVPDPGDPRLRGLRGVSVEAGNVIKVQSGLARHRTDRQKQAVTWTGGRHAVTRVEVVESYAGEVALCHCRLETGRTHQIRVHMAYIGHGLVGDATYGGRRKPRASVLGAELADALQVFPRQALHASVLGFRHPVQERFMRFESDLPADICGLRQELRDFAG